MVEALEDSLSSDNPEHQTLWSEDYNDFILIWKNWNFLETKKLESLELQRDWGITFLHNLHWQEQHNNNTTIDKLITHKKIEFIMFLLNTPIKH